MAEIVVQLLLERVKSLEKALGVAYQDGRHYTIVNPHEKESDNEQV